MMEEHLRRAMMLYRGDATVFATRPLSGLMLALALILLASVLLPVIRKQRQVAFRDS